MVWTKEDNLSHIDLKSLVWVRAQSKLNNKYVYCHSQRWTNSGSGGKWAECSLIIGMGCRVHVLRWSSVCEPYYLIGRINILRPRQKWPPFSRRRFQMHFLEWKCMNLASYLSLFLRFELTLFQHCLLIGAKPLSEPKMVSILTHICVTRPQWVKIHKYIFYFPNYQMLLHCFIQLWL